MSKIVTMKNLPWTTLFTFEAPWCAIGTFSLMRKKQGGFNYKVHNDTPASPFNLDLIREPKYHLMRTA